MLSIVHGPTGAFIASKIPNPLISIPLILASHYLEDRVPHWDVGQGLIHAKKSKLKAFFEELIFDFPLSIAIVYIFFQMGHPFNWQIWLGWFIGLLPDFLEFPYVFLNMKFFPIRELADFHGWVHRSTKSFFWGVLPQISILIYIFLLR